MKQESLNKKIDRVIEKLRIAQSEKNEKSIEYDWKKVHCLYQKNEENIK